MSATPAVPTVTPATPAIPSPAAQPSARALLVSPVFNRTLRAGTTHSDVKRLQVLLNTDPDTQIATIGVGSPGNETEYFGKLTQRAVERFQKKHGLASSGTPETTGFGLVGPATRAKIIAVYEQQAASIRQRATPSAPSAATPSPIAAAVSPVFNRGLDVGSKGEDVKRLQQLLNSDPDTTIAATDTGSPGKETEYFGSLTKTAVAKFQMKHGLVKSSADPGYGFVGPKTRTKMAEVFAKQQAPSSSSTPTPAPSTSDSPEQKLQKQINDLIRQVQELQGKLKTTP